MQAFFHTLPQLAAAVLIPPLLSFKYRKITEPSGGERSEEETAIVLFLGFIAAVIIQLK